MNYSSQERYKIIKLIGSGGMAEVFLAEDKILKKLVAVKKIKFSRLIKNENEKKEAKLAVRIHRIEREIKTLSAVEYESLVKLHDYFIDKGGYDTIVMEYVPGITLVEKLKSSGVYDLKDGLTFFLKILYAVKHIHSHGIIHRDLKPQNIIISPDGSFKITDFGIAFFKDQEHVTKTDNLIGSPFYLAPEIILGLNEKKITPKADIYSLGIILYEIFVGAPPFQKDVNIIKVIQNQLTSSIPMVSEINPKIPASVDKIISKATTKDPKKRYQNIEEMIKNIKQVLQNKPLSLKAKRQTQYTKKWQKLFVKKNKTILYYYYLIAFLIILLISITLVFLILTL